jgi:hypothetical protein
MKHIFRISLLAILMIMLLAPVTPTSAATKTTYWFTEVYDGPPSGGTMEVLPSGHIRLRDMTLHVHDDSNGPYLIGEGWPTLNCNLDASWTGPCWGTSHFVSTEGGVWDLVWEGKMVNNLPVSMHAVAIGSEYYEGMMGWLDIEGDVKLFTVLTH